MLMLFNYMAFAQLVTQLFCEKKLLKSQSESRFMAKEDGNLKDFSGFSKLSHLVDTILNLQNQLEDAVTLCEALLGE